MLKKYTTLDRNFSGFRITLTRVRNDKYLEVP